MAFSLFNKKTFKQSSNSNQTAQNLIMDIIQNEIGTANYQQALCYAHAVDMIARTIAQSELQIKIIDKKVNKPVIAKNAIYYRLNIKPNLIETGTNFKYKLVSKLLLDGKALVITAKKEKDGIESFFLADSYEASKEIMKIKTFSNVQISDDESNTLSMNAKYVLGNNAMYFVFNNAEIKKASQTFKNEISKMQDIADKVYKMSKVPKWRLKTPRWTTNND